MKMRFRFDPLIIKQALRPMIKIKSPIYLSFKPPSALRQQTHITSMRPLACLDGDLKSGVSVADLLLIMGLKSGIVCIDYKRDS